MEPGGDRRGRGALLHRLPLFPLALTVVVAGSAALLAVGASRVREWAVMTDELLYAKLAAAIGDTGSPLPTLHGEHVGFLGVVYPILLAPFYGTLEPVDGFEAAHVVNAMLMASAAVPAYLLARRLLARPWSLAVATLSVAVPWVVLSGFVMSEAAAYPVFLWTFLACERAVSEPSPRRDGLALAALAVAFFTRPQFLFLAAVLPFAAAIVEALAPERRGWRDALHRHRVLAAAYAAGIAVVVPLAALGKAHLLLGDYGVTATQGSLLPPGVWKAAAIHLDTVAVGVGVLPFLLAVAWALTSVRDEQPRARAFAALTALSLVALALETASYDLRFGGSGVVRDRYLFYLAPLLFLAATASLLEPRSRRSGLVGATAFFAGTVALADFEPVAGLWVDSPVSVLNGVIRNEAAGLPPGVFVALCGVLLGVIALGASWLPRTAAAAGFVSLVFVFCGSTTGYAFERLLSSRTPSGLPVTGESRVRDWIDRAAQGGSVALLAYPVSRDWGQSALVWWDVEFWNDGVSRAFVVPGGTFTYTPFPSRELQLDFASGRFPGTEGAPPYVLTALSDSRFGLASTQLAANVGLSLVAAERPYRARWATRGLDADGWTRPGQAATIRVYADPGSPAQLVQVAVTLDSPPEAQAPARFRLSGRAGASEGAVAPGSRSAAQAKVCVPAGSHADLTLEPGLAATIAGPPLGPRLGPLRQVGPVVSGVQTTATGTACRA